MPTRRGGCSAYGGEWPTGSAALATPARTSRTTNAAAMRATSLGTTMTVALMGMASFLEMIDHVTAKGASDFVGAFVPLERYRSLPLLLPDALRHRVVRASRASWRVEVPDRVCRRSLLNVIVPPLALVVMIPPIGKGPRGSGTRERPVAASTALALGASATLAARRRTTAPCRPAVPAPAHLEAVPPTPTPPPPMTPLPELAPRTLRVPGHAPMTAELMVAMPAALTSSLPYASKLAGLPRALPLRSATRRPVVQPRGDACP